MNDKLQVETEVSGILILSFLQACQNLKFYIDDSLNEFLGSVAPDGWYPVYQYNRLLETVASRYTNSSVVLEQLGVEMMQLWYEFGPGKAIVQSGVDFLNHQTSSEGYHSLIRGPAERTGNFRLQELDEAKRVAIVHSTTPFNRDLERGVLKGGMALTGDLRQISVENELDENVFSIHYRMVEDVSSEGPVGITSDEFFMLDVLDGNRQINGTDLQEVFFKYKELETELALQKSYWKSTNATLSAALEENKLQKRKLRSVNEQLTQANQSSDSTIASNNILGSNIDSEDLDKPCSVLLVDDEPDLADMVMSMLTKMGHAVTVASSVSIAMDTLSRNEFDIVISDLNMPELGGEDLFNLIKTHYPTLTDKLAFITGDSLGDKARNFLHDSKRPYLEKPFLPNELHEMMQSLQLGSRQP